LNSVLTKRPRDAIALTYLGAVAYLLLSAASWALVLPTVLASVTWTIPWLGPVTVKDFAQAVSIGNILAVCIQLSIDVTSGKNLANSLPTALAHYALFHGCVALLCIGWAVVRLRALATKQSYGTAQKAPRRRRWWRRPAIGNRPMLWKEVVIESGVRLNVLGRMVVLVLVAASFVPVFFIFDEVSRSYSWQQLHDAMNAWVRGLGSLVACLLLLAVATRASSSIGNERDRQTWDALLITPLESNTMLFAKWIGNVLSVRWGWVWLGAIYGLTLLTGGLHPLALVLLVGAWFVYAFMVSGIGLWFSMVSRTTLRATLSTLVCTVGAGVGHWLLWMCCIPAFLVGGPTPNIFEGIWKFQMGFTPPLALGYCFSFSWMHFSPSFGWRNNGAQEAILYGVLGTVCWMVLGLFLAGINGNRFRVFARRVPLKQRPAPDAQPRKPSAPPERPTEVPSPHGSSPSTLCDRQTS
jgi:ABC-type transport system involved in multi-copper enzyme maturation permease subunit